MLLRNLILVSLCLPVEKTGNKTKTVVMTSKGNIKSITLSTGYTPGQH